MTHQHLGDFGDFSLSVVVTSPPWYENCFVVMHTPTKAVAVKDESAVKLAELQRESERNISGFFRDEANKPRRLPGSAPFGGGGVRHMRGIALCLLG